MVADECPRRLRHRCRYALLAQRRDNRFHRQAAEPGRRTVGHYRHVNRLLAFIIGNTRIIDVYRDTFDGNIDTTTRLPDRYR
jgi:hypothetical protein